MRYLLLLLFFAVSACEVAPVSEAPARAEPVVARSGPSAVASYKRALRRIEPIAESYCRAVNRGEPPITCDFAFRLSDDPRLGVNAFQRLRRNGQPEVIFTESLLRILRNDDEVAFILGHEAAHHIEDHIAKTTERARFGAALLGGLVAATGQSSDSAVNLAANIGAEVGSRAFSKQFEIEADVLATYITEAAGYDPVVGAAPFGRMETGSAAFLATHPPSAERLRVVSEVAARIAADRRRGRTPRPPGF